MTARPLLAAWTAALAAIFVLLAAPALAAPQFPVLTGRVVDDAHVLTPQTAADLTAKLAALEAKTGRQLVVATVPDLQGYPIEDYGYQLGRAWGIGQKGQNNGVILLVAPKEHQVRIEVGYGLEPILTDALSSVIIQEQILPKFRAGDMQGGVVAGTGALVDQLSLDAPAAQAKAAQAAHAAQSGGGGTPFPAIIVFLVFIFVIGSIFRRHGGGGMGWILPMMLLSGGGRGWGDSGGGWSGGGFSGGGGSFGGGGASGSW
ncbi:MAG: TPM domain-containing protein [Caulobacterales bacterium]